MADLIDVACETVDDPGLLGLVGFVELKNVGGGTDVMDDEGFFVSFRQQDMLFEDFLL